MTGPTPETCFLCSKQLPHARGERLVRATLQQDGFSEENLIERVFHLTCFDAFTTGSRHTGVIWTYRIIGTPAEP